ncbi:MAG: DnaJ domain-containing protein [Cytophagaceae bacterium]
MSDYYSILGIPKGSKIEDIKKAYRRKAKEFHPDKNKSAGAQEKFIEITEAYEVLVNGKPSKKGAVPYRSAYDKYKNVYSAPSDPHEYHEWIKAVRERAWRESGMSYEEYQKESKARFEKQKRANIYASLIVLGLFAALALLALTAQWMVLLGLIGVAFVLGIIVRIFQVFREIFNFSKRKHR